MSQTNAMTIRFDAAIPQFTVPDVVRTAEYYRDVLGFQIAGYWNGEQVSLDPYTPPVFGIVSRDSVRVFFSRADQSDVGTGRAQGAYDAGFQIIGVDALAAELRARAPTFLTARILASTSNASSWSKTATG